MLSHISETLFFPHPFLISFFRVNAVYLSIPRFSKYFFFHLHSVIWVHQCFLFFSFLKIMFSFSFYFCTEKLYLSINLMKHICSSYFKIFVWHLNYLHFSRFSIWFFSLKNWSDISSSYYAVYWTGAWTFSILYWAHSCSFKNPQQSVDFLFCFIFLCRQLSQVQRKFWQYNFQLTFQSVFFFWICPLNILLRD